MTSNKLALPRNSCPAILLNNVNISEADDCDNKSNICVNNQKISEPNKNCEGDWQRKNRFPDYQNNLQENEIYEDENPRAAILFWLFVEKFTDLLLLFILILAVIKWDSLDHSIVRRIILLMLALFSVSSTIFAICWSESPWYTRFPTAFLYKILYLIFMIPIFYVLAVQIPLNNPFISPYISLITIGTGGLTYLFFALVFVIHEYFCKVKARCKLFYIYGILMPLLVLAGSQPIFFLGGIEPVYNVNHVNFTVNILIGVLTSLLFSFESAYIYQKYLKTDAIEAFLKTWILIPGYTTAYYDLKYEKSKLTVKIAQ